MGVGVGLARPTKIDSELSPALVVQTLPLGSTAMPLGVLTLPKPPAGLNTVAALSYEKMAPLFAMKDWLLWSNAIADGVLAVVEMKYVVPLVDLSNSGAPATLPFVPTPTKPAEGEPPRL